MPKNKVIGILNFHSSPSLGVLTENRVTGSTSCLGRYAFCDFALSNFANSGIQNVGLLIKDHPRSILKHLGSMTAWLTNTKICKETIMLNEAGLSGKESNTDLNNIKANDWVLYAHDVEYLVFQSSHIVANFDLSKMLKEHIARGEDISIAYTTIKDASKEFLEEYLFDIDEDGYVTDARPNPGKQGPACASTEVWIINRQVLKDMIDIEKNAPESLSFRHMIIDFIKSKRYRLHAYEYEGFVRCIDSYKHYCEFCLEMLNKNVFDEFFIDSWPHYTLTHDTPPALYGTESVVKNSFISNGVIVEGEVRDSVISRKVKIGKGAKIINSIVLSTCEIAEGAVVENCLIDKYSKIKQGSKVIGKDKKELKYLKQGTRL